MDFEGNFRHLGEVDVRGLRARVDAETEETWAVDTPPKRPGGVQEHVSTIALLFDHDGAARPPAHLPRYREYADLVEPILEQVAQHYADGGRVIRCFLSCLAPGGLIPSHRDSGESLMASHRVHVPISTNAGAVFTIGEERRHLVAGDIWEVNNHRVHSVENRGATPRVHLMLDWLSPREDTRLVGRTAASRLLA